MRLRSRARYLLALAVALAGFRVEVRLGRIIARHSRVVAVASAILVVPVRQVGWAFVHDALALALVNAEMRSRRHAAGGSDRALTAAGVYVELRLVLGTDCSFTSAFASRWVELRCKRRARVVFALLACAGARVAVEVGSVAGALVVQGLLAFTLASRWVEVRCCAGANDLSRVAHAVTSTQYEVRKITRAGLGIALARASIAVEVGRLGWASLLSAFARAGGRIEFGLEGRAV